MFEKVLIICFKKPKRPSNVFRPIVLVISGRQKSSWFYYRAWLNPCLAPSTAYWKTLEPVRQWNKKMLWVKWRPLPRQMQIKSDEAVQLYCKKQFWKVQRKMYVWYTGFVTKGGESASVFNRCLVHCIVCKDDMIGCKLESPFYSTYRTLSRVHNQATESDFDSIIEPSARTWGSAEVYTIYVIVINIVVLK